MPSLLKTVDVAISKLKPHPRNYRKHPKHQLEHLMKSIDEHGFYRNIAVAKDFTILAGHGVVEAATLMKLKKVPVIHLQIDPNSAQAFKILTGDNEISKLAQVDESMLAEVLKDINDMDGEIEGLLGTGFSQANLAQMIIAAAPTEEVEEFDANNEWTDMPEFDNQDLNSNHKIIMHFKNYADVQAFGRLIGQSVTEKTKSLWFPPDEKCSTTDKYFGGAPQ